MVLVIRKKSPLHELFRIRPIRDSDKPVRIPSTKSYILVSKNTCFENLMVGPTHLCMAAGAPEIELCY